ncbi:hypothetical protein PGB90_003254 [Kerria lacca]
MSMRKHYLTRFIGLIFLVLVFVTVCVYYGSYSGVGNITNTNVGFDRQPAIVKLKGLPFRSKFLQNENEQWSETNGEITANTCPVVLEAKTNIDTVQQFSKFEFQPFWLKSREYWDESFEERYNQNKRKWPRLPLKIFQFYNRRLPVEADIRIRDITDSRITTVIYAHRYEHQYEEDETDKASQIASKDNRNPATNHGKKTNVIDIFQREPKNVKTSKWKYRLTEQTR